MTTSRLASRLAVAIGGVAVLLVALSTRPGQAVVSTLVQVVNTPANPVPTLDNARNPANIVELIARAPNGHSGTFALQGPDGRTTPFTSVPAGKTLVLVSGDFLAIHLAVPLLNIQFGILQPDQSVPDARVWVVPGTSTTVLSWPPGIVIGSGQTPVIGAFGDDVVIRFRGYFTSP